MEKNIIGEWGAELDDGEYAKALAALGVLESTGTQQHPPSDDPQELLKALTSEFEGGERTVIWRDAFNPQGTDLSSWRGTSHQNPAALASGWQLLIDQVAWQPRNRPRLAIKAAWRERLDLFELESLYGWLLKSEVVCQGLNLMPDNISDQDCRYLWHWPVQVGIPSGPMGELLMPALRATDRYWVEELIQLQWIGETRDACDLLILPPGVAAQLAEEPRLRLRASFIICLDDPVKFSQIPGTPVAQLLKRTGAAGIAMVGQLHQGDVPDWFREIIRNLSHDMPVHAAVWEVGRYVSAIPPAILGLPHVLDRLRILAIAERVDRKRDLLLGAKSLPPVDFGFGAQSEADYVRAAPFTSEVEYGIPAKTRFSQVEENLDNSTPPRWIQADLRHDQVGAQPAKALAPSQPSLVSVYIGPSAIKRADAAFPEQEIDFRDGPVQVDLQVELTGAAAAALPPQHRYQRYIQNQSPLAQFFQALSQIIPAPQPASVGSPLRSLASQSISLPAAGNSEQAEFVVWPQPGVSAVTGRIAVIHQNRIIQTALLTAPVGVENEVKTGVVVEAEQIVHPRLDDLDERRGGDAAIILADDLGGPLRLTITRNGIPEDVPLDNVQSAITDIRNVVLGATRRAADTLDLTTSKEMRDLLFALSYHGSLLYQFLQKRLGNWLDDLERIQILTYGNKYFPLEYVYCGPSANLNAEVCPNALQALKDGVCKSCETKGSPDRICPLFFWGFSKVIERHANQPARPARGDELKRMPTPTRTPFGAVTPAILAASDKAFDFTDGETVQKELLDLIGRLGAGQPANVAQDWPGWRKLIETGPKLLILLVHSDTIGANIELLEIGKGDKLLKTAILPDVVGAVETPQLLLLLGCAVAQVNTDFAPYPEKFHEAGADIIIAPLAPILGADAAPIACRISELLGEWMAKQREITFGDLLKQIRCDLLAKGHPGVLGLVSFGDADWIFGG